MKVLTLFLFFCLFNLTVDCQVSIRQADKEQTIIDDPNGSIQWINKNGRILFEKTYLTVPTGNGNKEISIHLEREYYTSGVIKKSTPYIYIDGSERINGLAFGNYENGNALFKEEFKNDTLNGVLIHFNENGSERVKAKYNNDLINGTVYENDKNGTFICSKEYVNGRLTDVYFYDNEDNSNNLHIDSTNYYEYGNELKTERGEIFEGRLFSSGEALTTYFYEFYKAGKRNGKSKGWYPNGQLQYEGYYVDNLPDGTWIDNFENGQRKYESTYQNGKLIDKKCWDADGNIIKCD